MKLIRETCNLRPEVLEGELSDAIFAADFGKILEGNAPDVYQSADTFFRNTHPAESLKKVIKTIFDRFTANDEAGAIVRLSTGFGGGKTHTLIALWHLAKNIQNSRLGTELIDEASRPRSVSVAGADGRLAGSEIYRDYGAIKTHSLWGELAYHLSGEVGYNKMRSVDNPEKVPDAGLIRQILPDEPVLILLDEMPVYMKKLSDRGSDSLLSFLDSLSSEICARRHAVLVITDTAGQVAYEKESAELGKRIDAVVSRRASDFDPIGGESAQVLIRRLFESVDPSAAQQVADEYANAYKQGAEAHPDLLPSEATQSRYAERIAECYPFHPRLLETTENRFGALQDFQKSRGVLRLFSRILRDVSEKKSDLSIITAGELDWTSDRIQADLLNRLNRDNFKPAVDADIVGHAGKLDHDFSSDIHRRVATALLLESLPMNPNSAMDEAESTLAVLRPSDVVSEPSEAIFRLMRNCWHTYKTDQGKFQFRYEANANKVIEERAENIPIEDARISVRTSIQKYFGGRQTFQLCPYPTAPIDVRSNQKLQLVLCESEELAKRICDHQDDSNPDAPTPRAYRNSIFAIAPTQSEFEKAAIARRLVMAAEEVQKEHKKASGKGKDPLLEQIEKLLPDLEKKARITAKRAFDRVLFQDRRTISLQAKYTVDEAALGGGQKGGQARLMELLKAEELIYEITDPIDHDLLMQLIRGATPSIDHSGAYTAKSIHERALSSKKLRLFQDESPIRNTIIRDVHDGKLVVRLPDNEVYNREGSVVGEASNRRRSDKKLKTLELSAEVLVAPIDAHCVTEWLKIPEVKDQLTTDKAALIKKTNSKTVERAIAEGKINYETNDDGTKIILNDRKFDQWNPVPLPLPPSSPTVDARTWAEAINHAKSRPLTKLKLTIAAISSRDRLMACAQPFNANPQLSVLAEGKLEDRGSVRFKVNRVKVSSPIKPFDIAKRMLKDATESTFEADLVLDFGSAGVDGTGDKFERARTHGLDDVKLFAYFGPEKKA